MFTSKGPSVRRWVLHRSCRPGPSDCQITAVFSALTVLPGLSQALSGDAGHPVRPQEAAGSPPAVRQGFLSGGQLCQRRHPLHHHQVHHRDRETGAQDEGETVGSQWWVTLWIMEAFKGTYRLPQGIYRVNGVKTRVEKLCQAFENGKELVELSQCSPHDISNVLKLYLRQVRSMSDNRRCPQGRYVSCCHFNISASSPSPSCLSGCTTA